jgi:pimeloyl-ACP methyl ester carboxylesterase
MRRGALVVVVLAVLVTAMPAGAEAQQPLPEECAGARRVPEADGTGRTPVLFVHGFSGSPNNFRRSRDGRPDMIETVAALDGVTAYTFDYSKHSSEWVTDPAIGPKLAQAIACLGRASGHKVVAIAHSMGGLAVRYAQGQVIRGRPVADSLARVVTIGTPTRGVILLSFAGGDVGNAALQAVVHASSDVCDEHEKPRRHLCVLLGAAGAPAVTAMAPGSPELAALPPWGVGVAVHPMAANLRLRLSIFGLGTTVDLGDIVATVESATADASPRELPFVAACRTELTNLVDVVDRSPCSHTNELGNHRIVEAVLAQVELAVAQAEPI